MSTRLFYGLPFLLASIAVSLAVITVAQVTDTSPDRWLSRAFDEFESTRLQVPDDNARLLARTHAARMDCDILGRYDGIDGSMCTQELATREEGGHTFEPYCGLMNSQDEVDKVLATFAVSESRSTQRTIEDLNAVSASLRELLASDVALSSRSEQLESKLDWICRRLLAVASEMSARQSIDQALHSFDTAFAEGDYKEVQMIADSILDQFGSALALEEREHITSQRERSIFREELESHEQALKHTQDPTELRGLLNAFVARFSQAQNLNTEVQAAVEVQRRRLEAVERTITERENAANALERIERLRASSGKTTFPEEVQELAAILAAYPSAESTRMIRDYCRESLRKAFPAKETTAPDGLEEFEYQASPAAPGRLISGFIRQVTDSSGNVTGYKVYKTRAALENPQVQVGIYTATSVSDGPCPVFPAICVSRYNEARDRFLGEVEKTQAYEDFVRLNEQLSIMCTELSKASHEYTSKPGAFPESMSFAEEVSRLSAFAEEGVWKAWERIFGGNDT